MLDGSRSLYAAFFFIVRTATRLMECFEGELLVVQGRFPYVWSYFLLWVVGPYLPNAEITPHCIWNVSLWFHLPACEYILCIPYKKMNLFPSNHFNSCEAAPACLACNSFKDIALKCLKKHENRSPLCQSNTHHLEVWKRCC